MAAVPRNPRPSSMVDLYAVLGVARDANAGELKRAYRRLARESHPDRNPGDPRVEEQFKRAANAYSVLSDPVRRAKYDRLGEIDAPRTAELDFLVWLRLKVRELRSRRRGEDVRY